MINGEPGVCDWTDIVDIAATDDNVIGLKSDGTVVTNREDIDLSGWTDIVAVSCEYSDFFGLQADGTVIDQSGNVVMTDIKVPYGDQITEE